MPTAEPSSLLCVLGAAHLNELKEITIGPLPTAGERPAWAAFASETAGEGANATGTGAMTATAVTGRPAEVLQGGVYTLR